MSDQSYRPGCAAAVIVAFFFIIGAFVLIALAPKGALAPRPNAQQARPGQPNGQQDRWEKKRQHYGNQGFQVVRYHTSGTEQWESLLLKKDSRAGAWGRGGVSLYQMTDVQEARTWAKEAAGNIDDKAAVVLDMFSNEHPFPIVWYADDGFGVKEMTTPPSDRLGRSLDAYIQKMQTQAD